MKLEDNVQVFKLTGFVHHLLESIDILVNGSQPLEVSFHLKVCLSHLDLIFGTELLNE
jgi:hypothetical protein